MPNIADLIAGLGPIQVPNTYELLGWMGMICILVAYVLLIIKHRFGHGMPYLLTNIAGSFLLSISLLYARAWPGLALQSIFILISFYGVWLEQVKKKTQTAPQDAAFR